MNSPINRAIVWPLSLVHKCTYKTSGFCIRYAYGGEEKRREWYATPRQSTRLIASSPLDKTEAVAWSKIYWSKIVLSQRPLVSRYNITRCLLWLFTPTFYSPYISPPGNSFRISGDYCQNVNLSRVHLKPEVGWIVATTDYPDSSWGKWQSLLVMICILTRMLFTR